MDRGTAPHPVSRRIACDTHRPARRRSPSPPLGLPVRRRAGSAAGARPRRPRPSRRSEPLGCTGATVDGRELRRPRLHRPRAPAGRRRRAVRAVVDPHVVRRPDPRPSWRSRGGPSVLPLGTMTQTSPACRVLPDRPLTDADGNVVTTKIRRHAASTATPSGSGPTRRPGRRTRGAARTTRTRWARCRASRPGWSVPLRRAGQRPLQLRPGRYTVTVGIAAALRPALRAHRRAGARDVHADRVARGLPARATTGPRARRRAAGPPGRDRADRARPGGTRRRPEPGPAVAAGVRHRSNGKGTACASPPPSGTPATARWSSTASAAPDEDVMDAYQYFFDADGNQTGYQQVGADALARRQPPALALRGLRAATGCSTRTRPRRCARRSSRSAWPTPTPSTTRSPAPTGSPRTPTSPPPAAAATTLSIREVLSSGSGDTYAQYRAGQAFRPRRPAERHLLRRGRGQPARQPGRVRHRQQRGRCAGSASAARRAPHGRRWPRWGSIEGLA